jgi:pimeloyl-ACP methyl ester carboxylesterase
VAPDRIDVVRALARENAPAGVANALRALAERADSSSLLPSIGCPVACVVGAEDSITPPAIVRAMAERIPRAVTIVIPEAGHLASLEAPDAFNRAVESVFGRSATEESFRSGPACREIGCPSGAPAFVASLGTIGSLAGRRRV